MARDLDYNSRVAKIGNMAINEAEKRIKDGTASSQLITTMIKQGSRRELLEIERLETEIALAKAKIKDIESRESQQAIMEEALEAFKSYSGVNDD